MRRFLQEVVRARIDPWVLLTATTLPQNLELLEILIKECDWLLQWREFERRKDNRNLRRRISVVGGFQVVAGYCERRDRPKEMRRGRPRIGLDRVGLAPLSQPTLLFAH